MLPAAGRSCRRSQTNGTTVPSNASATSGASSFARSKHSDAFGSFDYHDQVICGADGYGGWLVWCQQIVARSQGVRENAIPSRQHLRPEDYIPFVIGACRAPCGRRSNTTTLS
jgi:hypothetical protein